MQRKIVNVTYPLSIEVIDFLELVTLHFQRKLEKRNMDDFDLEYELESFYQDLKFVLMHPADNNINETCGLFDRMDDADKLQLLKMRPEIIHDSSELINLLRDHKTSVENKILLAHMMAEKLYDFNFETMFGNIMLTVDLLPEQHQKSLYEFCLRLMRRINREQGIDPSNSSKKLYNSVILLAALSIKKDFTIFQVLYREAAKFNSAASLIQALHKESLNKVKLSQLKPAVTPLWQQPSVHKNSQLALKKSSSLHHKK